MSGDLKEQIQNFRAELEDVEAAQSHFRKPTKEEIEKAQKHNAEVVALFERGARLTQDETELAHAIRLEAFYRERIAHGVTDPTVLRDLTNSLITQGRYEDALDYANAEQLNELAELIEARDKDDDIRCECPSTKLEGKNVPSEYIVKRLWHPTKQEFCWLHKCNECGHVNLVSELPQEIAIFHASRMDAANKNR